MGQIFPKPPLQGNSQQATIAVTDVAQPLLATRTLVRQVTVMADGSNSGSLAVGLGPNPLLPQLFLDAGPDGFIDLAQIQIKGTAGDKANFQVVYAP